MFCVPMRYFWYENVQFKVMGVFEATMYPWVAYGWHREAARKLTFWLRICATKNSIVLNLPSPRLRHFFISSLYQALSKIFWLVFEWTRCLRGVLYFLNGIVSYENVKCKLFFKCFLSGHQLLAELVPRSGAKFWSFRRILLQKRNISTWSGAFLPTNVSRHVVEKLRREAAKNFAFLCAISVTKT